MYGASDLMGLLEHSTIEYPFPRDLRIKVGLDLELGAPTGSSHLQKKKKKRKKERRMLFGDAGKNDTKRNRKI